MRGLFFGAIAMGLLFGACTRQSSPPPADPPAPLPTATTAPPAPSDGQEGAQAQAAQPIEPEPADDDAVDTAVVGAALTPPAATPPPTGSSAPLLLTPALDLRTHQPRSRAMLVAETSALSRLLAATAQNSPDRPALMKRTAEDYVELRKAGVSAASNDAVKHYANYIAAYPNAPAADEARYYLGLELMVMGEVAKSRRAFYDVIRTSPTSKFVPYAYHAFGDLFFSEGKHDPAKYDLAKQAYFEVLKFTSSPIAPEAALQLYRVAKAQHDTSMAAKMRAMLASKFGSSSAASRIRSLP